MKKILIRKIKSLKNKILDLWIIDLEKSQWWSLKKLEQLQKKRLKKIIKYAYGNIPGYHKLWKKHNIMPKDIKSIKDLQKLPIISREELQNNPNFVNQKFIDKTLQTGGSTGTSLQYYNDRRTTKIRKNSHYRGWKWMGYNSKEKIAIVTSTQGNIKGEKVLNLSGDMTEKNLKIISKEFINFQPEFIRAYVGSVYILAKYLLDNKIKIDSVKAVNVISENLYDYQRKIIEQVFNCKVFEEYCCNDGGACAWECEKHSAGLHLVMERAIIEEIDGEMIVTDLWNMAMPFIRYKNGDKIKFLDKRCDCGRELPLIKVRGRDNDVLISQKGPISPSFLVHHGIGHGAIDYKDNFRSSIRAIQYIQEKNFKLIINIVKNSWCTDEEIQQLVQTLNKITHNMKLQINFVKDIPKSKKGKRQFIINNDKKLLDEFYKLK